MKVHIIPCESGYLVKNEEGGSFECSTQDEALQVAKAMLKNKMKLATFSGMPKKNCRKVDEVKVYPDRWLHTE